jgi:hypothetical protein
MFFWNGIFLRRVTIAILCASIAGDLYYGATRTFVYLGGAHMFFEWQNNENRIDAGFLKNMRVGAPLIEVEREVKQALDTNPGPYFLGPRIDFYYAVFGLRSPERYPPYLHPGTSVSRASVPQLLENWRSHRFATLIFLNDGIQGGPSATDFTLYPQEFLDIIDRAYVQNDKTYPDIVVYRLRGASTDRSFAQ